MTWQLTVVLIDLVAGLFFSMVHIARGRHDYGTAWETAMVAVNILMVVFIFQGAGSLNWAAWTMIIIYSINLLIQFWYNITGHVERYGAASPATYAVWMVVITAVFVWILFQIPVPA